MNKFFTLLFLSFLLFIPLANAHQPVIEDNDIVLKKGEFIDLGRAKEISDPTRASQAVYGSLSQPQEVDLYKFIPEQDDTVPIEVLVPVSVSNQDFRPSFAVIKSNARGVENVSENNIPFNLPDGWIAQIVFPPSGERSIFFEPFSVEKLYRGTERNFVVSDGQVYYIAVFEQQNYTGDYSLGIGTAEDFSNVSYVELLKKIFLIKLGLAGNNNIPWPDILGLFLFIAGFVIGLGAVTVIDLHGFLARKSSYWTEATTRTHKITKPLIWLGLVLAMAGAMIYYRLSGFSSVALFQVIIAIVLIANGYYLSFKVSPYLLQREKEDRVSELLPAKWQRGIAVSFVISFLGWWSSLFLLVWHLLMVR